MAVIFALDDEQRFLDLMKMALETAGHSLLAFRDGKEAMFHISHPKNAPPELILLDGNMPNIDGETFWAFLQQSDRTRFIPVILVTADKTNLRSFPEGKHNLAAMIEKPFDLGVLRKTVTEVLQRPKRP